MRRILDAGTDTDLKNVEHKEFDVQCFDINVADAKDKNRRLVLSFSHKLSVRLHLCIKSTRLRH